jgi:cell division protein FtsI/penicillin-binding protein 2
MKTIAKKYYYNSGTIGRQGVEESYEEILHGIVKYIQKTNTTER